LPEGVREGNENLVLLTPAAGAKVAALIARERQGEFLRVAISGGGCNGLSYKMKFVPEPRRGDILVRSAGARVVVDSKSALYLKGTHLDYSAALVSGGFKFSNPNAKASCSCGESFSV
jgi:iron-sulfur cluster assembly protein